MTGPRGAAGALTVAAQWRASGELPPAAYEAADVIAAGLVQQDSAALSRPVIEAIARMSVDLAAMVASVPSLDPGALVAIPALVAGELERRAADA